MYFTLSHDQYDQQFNGASLKDVVHITYPMLVNALGEPPIIDLAEKKIDAIWFIKFSDNKVATVYSWKNCTNPRNVLEWSIGAHSNEVADRVKRILFP